MSDRSLIAESHQISLAIEMIELGARLQVLQAETDISRRRLIALYKEIHGRSPPKGMLPYSTDWYLTWLPNIHSSLFYNIYESLIVRPDRDRMSSVVTAYQVYLDQTDLQDSGKPVLGLTRAWMLIRFFENEMMTMSACRSCGGYFVNHAFELQDDFVCGICSPPSRAGKRAGHKRRRVAPKKTDQSVDD